MLLRVGLLSVFTLHRVTVLVISGASFELVFEKIACFALCFYTLVKNFSTFVCFLAVDLELAAKDAKLEQLANEMKNVLEA